METSMVSCNKVYRAHDSRVKPVALAVAHWTASPPKGPGVADPWRVKTWLTTDSVLSSTHFVILRDGKILQAAGLDERTWHCGGSVWHGVDGREVHDHPNLESIGFDLESVGPVYPAPDGHGFVDSYHGRYLGAEPIKAGAGLFEPYTPAQLVALKDLVAHLAQELPVLRDPRRWVGHSQIMATKSDPGPLFPWEMVRTVVAGVGT